MEDAPKKWRVHYIPATAFFNLDHACRTLNKALDEHGYGCYLVGSSLTRPDYWDVDVRYILSDEGYDRFFKLENGWNNALWSLMCTTISAWLSTQSGLRIDFQIQRMTQANLEHPSKTGHDRQPLGIFLDYPGERPGDLKAG